MVAFQALKRPAVTKCLKCEPVLAVREGLSALRSPVYAAEPVF
jgi:hypothetical protein